MVNTIPQLLLLLQIIALQHAMPICDFKIKTRLKRLKGILIVVRVKLKRNDKDLIVPITFTLLARNSRDNFP